MPRRNLVPSRSTLRRIKKNRQERNQQQEDDEAFHDESSNQERSSTHASRNGSNSDEVSSETGNSSSSNTSAAGSPEERDQRDQQDVHNENEEENRYVVEREDVAQGDREGLEDNMQDVRQNMHCAVASEESSESDGHMEVAEAEHSGSNTNDEDSLGENNSEEEVDDDEDQDEEENEGEEEDEENIEDEEEEEGDVGNNEGIPEDFDPPLYQGAPITLGQSLLLILTFSIVHNLTGVALADLLGLIAFHCIDANKKCKKTLYTFRQFFVGLKSPLKFHYFCSCFASLPSKNSRCNICGEDTKVCSFIEIPILAQLSKMLKRKGFYESLSHRRTRVKCHPNNYEDIYDSNVYKEKIRNGEIDFNTITFCWNVDGVKIFKSTNLEIWPVYLAINELPYHLRFKKENCLIAGIWCGPSTKPHVSLFLRAFHSQLTELFRGVNFHIPGRAYPVWLRGFILCGTCDLPAKACFLNWNSHSGYYSCHRCKIRGEKSERTDFVMAFPSVNDSGRRSMEETLAHAALANQSGRTIFGIKGRSDLILFVRDYVRTTAIDVMHCVWEGVTKKLARLWFDEDFKNYNFSLFAAVDQVSDILVTLTPPSFVRRMPRSLVDHLAYWKAQEFKTFLLYYSIPLLSRVMSPIYFNHHLLLVHGIFLLNQKSISPEMIEEAEKCLWHYVNQFAELYHIRFLSLNFHLLLHLGDVVRDLGPLWVTSCMPFEDLNGSLKKLVHGTRYVNSQISSALSQAMSLPIMLDQLPDGDVIKQWCQKILVREHLKITERISENLWTVGKYTKLRNNPPVIDAALRQCHMEDRNVIQFSRLKRGRVVISSQAYTRQTRANSTVVKFTDNNGHVKFGLVHTFLRISECNCMEKCLCEALFYAVINILDTRIPFQIPLHPPRSVSHVMQTYDTNNFVAVPVSNIISLCVSLTVYNTQFTMDLVNVVEDE